ncbi:ParD-like family protein [Thiotrichales bacterium 19S11-10]|nr:ParD-like family protein [Thiotrichales bacterium 19S11-10]
MAKIRLPSELIKLAEAAGNITSCAIAKQIEHWVKIGRIVEENPDLPYSFIKESLTAKAEMDTGLVCSYTLKGK